MSRDKPLLTELASKGKPLAEVVVILKTEINLEDAMDKLDNLAPDISAAVVPVCFQAAGDKINYEVRMEATKEALLRVFGWKLTRQNLPKWNEKSKKYEGVHLGAFYWEEMNSPVSYPDSVSGFIQKMGLVQPGSSDNGEDDNISYTING